MAGRNSKVQPPLDEAFNMIDGLVKKCRSHICGNIVPHAEHKDVMPGRKDTRSSHGEEKGSLGSTMTKAQRIEAARRQAQYEADRRAFEQWARQGFMSGFENDDDLGPIPDDDVVE